MEREREKGARGGDDIILHFLAVRSRTGARRTRAREGREEEEWPALPGEPLGWAGGMLRA